ncbi:MAG: Hpt domain-containing protein, partial [Planctomycetaceae bacterium]
DQTVRDGPGRTSLPLINWAGALEVVQGDEELLSEVVQAVLEEVPQLLAGLGEAIDSGDTRTIQRLAHTIKGNMRTFQATAGIEIAEQLEQHVQQDRLQSARRLLQRLKTQADAFLAALRDSPYAGSADSSDSQ